ncbi:MAG: hypothetical protein HPY50_12240 [Firmicutes bacterium]|nr:hypothetical protein [Bacillota bacterium]
MQAYIPYLSTGEITRKGTEEVEVVVDRETSRITMFQAACLGGIFGWGGIEIEEGRQEDFLKIVRQPWPQFLVTVARHLVLQPEDPADEYADSRLYRYVLPREPHLSLSSHPFPRDFVENPDWPGDTDTSAISKLHAAAYCSLCGAYTSDETRQWLHSHARLIVKCLQNLRHARLFVPHSRYLTKHSYLHDISILLGILIRGAGEEFMVTMTLCGGQQFLHEVGLV